MARDINDTPNRTRITASASQSVFTVPFPFDKASDLKVWKNRAPLALSTDYTVAGAGGTSGTVTLVSSAALNDEILIIRDMPIERVGDFPVSGPFDVASLNAQLDALTMMAADLETRIERRTLRVDQTDLPETLSSLPGKTARANRMLGFDNSGNPVAVSLVFPPVVTQYGAIEFETFLSMTLNTSLTYSNVTAGQSVHVRASDSMYLVLPSSSSSYHIITSGGIKLNAIVGSNGVSIKAFGAVGDGATDDTAAIQLAFNSGVGSIYVPPGTYNYSSALTINSTLRLHGEGTFNETTLLESGITVTANNVVIEDVSFSGSDVSPSVWNTIDFSSGSTDARKGFKQFVYFYNCSNGVVRNVKTNGKRGAITTEGCSEMVIEGNSHTGLFPVANQQFQYTTVATSSGASSVQVVESIKADTPSSGVIYIKGGTYRYSAFNGSTKTFSGLSPALFENITGSDTAVACAVANANYHTCYRIIGGTRNQVINNNGAYSGSVVLIGLESSNNRVVNTVAKNCHDNGIYNSSGNYSSFFGGTLEDINGGGLKIRGSGHTVSGFTLVRCGPSLNAAISLTGNGSAADSFGSNGFGTICFGNTIRQSAGHCISVGSQDGYLPRDFIVSNNTIEDHQGSEGFTAITVSGERGMKVVNNIIRGSTADYAIGVFGAVGNRAFDFDVSGNTISNCVVGIRAQNVDDSIFSGNTISGNSSLVMDFRLCDRNFVTGNRSSSSYVIGLGTIAGRECYNNTVTNNSVFSATGDDSNIIAPALKYEVGVWTPSYVTTGTQFSSVTYTSNRQGTYTRIGKLVTITGIIETDAITVGTASGSVTIDGLPFANSNGGVGSVAAVTVSRVNGFGTNHPTASVIFRNQSVISLRYRTSANGADSALSYSDLDPGSSKNLMVFSATYVTDA